jgi:hypothetical protein
MPDRVSCPDFSAAIHSALSAQDLAGLEQLLEQQRNCFSALPVGEQSKVLADLDGIIHIAKARRAHLLGALSRCQSQYALLSSYAGSSEAGALVALG